MSARWHLSLLILLAPLLVATPVAAEVLTRVAVLPPGQPLSYGELDRYVAVQAQRAETAAWILGLGSADAAVLATRLRERGVDASVLRPRADDWQRFGAPALLEILRREAAIAGAEPLRVAVTDAHGLAQVQIALAQNQQLQTALAGLVVDARQRLPQPAALQPAALQPPALLAQATSLDLPVLLVIDPPDARPRGEVMELMLAWRSRGIDAQLYVLPGPAHDSGQGSLAQAIVEFAGARASRRAARFESLQFSADPGFAQIAADVDDAEVRVVGITAVDGYLRVGLDGASGARIAQRAPDQARWTIEANFGRQSLLSLVQADAAQLALSQSAARLILRAFDPARGVWQLVASWPARESVKAAAIWPANERTGWVVLLDQGARASLVHVGADGAVAAIAPPRGAIQAWATSAPRATLLSAEGAGRTLWQYHGVQGWQAIAGFASTERFVAARPIAGGDWLLWTQAGDTWRLDPSAGRAERELDQRSFAALFGVSIAGGAALPIASELTQPQTGDRLGVFAGDWRFGTAPLLLWREGSGRHGIARIADATQLTALASAGAGAELIVAGLDQNLQPQLWRGRLRDTVPAAGWWARADDPSQGLFVAWGRERAVVYAIARAADGTSSWRALGARAESERLLADADPADILLDTRAAQVTPVCTGARVAPGARLAVGRVAQDAAPACLVWLPAHPSAPAVNSVWQQADSPRAPLILIAARSLAAPNASQVWVLYHDASGAPRWRQGLWEPAASHGVAALASPIRCADCTAGQRRWQPQGLLLWDRAGACDASELRLEWRPFALAEGAIPGLPAQTPLAARRQDLALCY